MIGLVQLIIRTISTGYWELMCSDNKRIHLIEYFSSPNVKHSSISFPWGQIKNRKWPCQETHSYSSTFAIKTPISFCIMFNLRFHLMKLKFISFLNIKFAQWNGDKSIQNICLLRNLIWFTFLLQSIKDHVFNIS